MKSIDLSLLYAILVHSSVGMLINTLTFGVDGRTSFRVCLTSDVILFFFNIETLVARAFRKKQKHVSLVPPQVSGTERVVGNRPTIYGSVASRISRPP